jgi:bile acid-coenzyme A ligase
VTLISFPRRLGELAAAAPERIAVTCVGETVTRSALPNSIEWLATAIAAWKVGAIPQPVSSRLPAVELRAILELARPRLVAGDVDVDLEAGQVLPYGYRPPAELSDEPLADVVSPAWKAPTSGGSTGRPKLIVSGERAELDTNDGVLLGIAPEGCLVMPGPLYHNAPSALSLHVLLWGKHVVLLPRFDAEATLRAVAEHRADVLYVVPTMMKRISRLPDDVRLGYDLSSLQMVWHLAEPCPEWLKEQWIDWLGADMIWELYGGTEGQATTTISGPEWLERRGSVGRPIEGEFMICDEDGEPVPPDTVGEVWMRSTRDTPTYHYLGAEPKTREGGWESLGDLGKLDADGYLYLTDRLQDMILSGGANIYPAEVEAALSEHPAIRSCVVIGLPDDDLGQRVHAIVEADGADVDTEDLNQFLGERLVSYKLPRSWEFVDESLRSDAGKVRREELRNARV